VPSAVRHISVQRAGRGRAFLLNVYAEEIDVVPADIFEPGTVGSAVQGNVL
jgi:hypothetical protein